MPDSNHKNLLTSYDLSGPNQQVQMNEKKNSSSFKVSNHLEIHKSSISSQKISSLSVIDLEDESSERVIINSYDQPLTINLEREEISKRLPPKASKTINTINHRKFGSTHHDSKIQQLEIVHKQEVKVNSNTIVIQDLDICQNDTVTQKALNKFYEEMQCEDCPQISKRPFIDFDKDTGPIRKYYAKRSKKYDRESSRKNLGQIGEMYRSAAPFLNRKR